MQRHIRRSHTAIQKLWAFKPTLADCFQKIPVGLAAYGNALNADAGRGRQSKAAG